MKHTFNFYHDFNARNDPKLLKVRMKYGAAGYGIFFMLIESLAESTDHVCETDYEVIAYGLHEDAEIIRSIVEDFGLFCVEDGYFFSQSLNVRLKELDSASEQRKERASKASEARWKKNAKPMLSECSSDAKPMLSECSSDAKPMLSECSSDAKPMLSECSSDAKPMLSECSSDAKPMLSECSSDAKRCQHNITKHNITKEEEEEKEEESTDNNEEFLLEKDEEWLEAIAMNHKLSKQDVTARLKEFYLDIKCRGKTHRDVQDAKRHFNDWLKTKRRRTAEGRNAGRVEPPEHMKDSKDWLKGL